MANIDSAFGLKPVAHKNGAPYNGACRAFVALSTYATALYIGDPIIRVASGSNTTEVDGFAVGTLPACQRATNGDGNAISGVIVGFGPNRDDLTKQYRPASTERVIYVADDPDLIFDIQDDAGATLDASVVGLNAVLSGSGGSTVSGKSSAELDAGSSDGPAADASNQLTIIGLAPYSNNAVGDNAIWRVRINNHTDVNGAIGI